MTQEWRDFKEHLLQTRKQASNMLENVKVDKDRLLATLEENREAHIEEYNTAVAVFREEAVKALRALAKEVAKEDGELKTNVEMPIPVSYEKEYDNAIAMVEWSQDDEITLEAHDFKAFVLDEWGWRGHFAAATSHYNAR